jgi:hypothetical protein
MCLALGGVTSDVLDQRKQGIDIDSVDDGWFSGLRLGEHESSPCSWM